ncbi:MAG TPA: polyamine aminopropyltransferase, partial [Candidatus Melainabacteria bacterium]|nr:polyamine aminopropyltransferase [Candidatus Melainabacteria bacterium]
SPYFARNSFWCVVATLESVGFKTIPYHAYVPSFGDWGYIIAREGGASDSAGFQFGHHYPGGLKYVSKDSVASMLDFPADMKPSVREVNKLNNQSLVHLFEAEWDEYAETF